MIRASLLLLGLAGCSDSTEILGLLSGSWAGTVDAESVPSLTTADFTFVDDSYLEGTVTIAEPRGTQAYSVRRTEVFGSDVAIDLQTIDLLFNLSLVGEVEDGGFSGQATMTTDCGEPSPCGWVGSFQLSPSPTVP